MQSAGRRVRREKAFFCSSPLPFGGSTVLSLTRGPAGLSATQECRDTNCTTRTTKSEEKEDAGARKGRKVAKRRVFWWFCGSGGLKSRLAKAVRRHLGR